MSCNCNTRQVKFKKLYNDVITPHKGSAYSVGYDVHAYIVDKDTKVLRGTACTSSLNKIVLDPKSVVIFGTGLSTEFSKDMVLEVHIRSSVGIKKGLRLCNSVGIIDPDYRGEIKIAVENTTEEQVSIEHGERLVQFIFKKLPTVELIEVETLEDSVRSTGGIGSTGEK